MKPLVVNILELLRTPGTHKPVHAAVTVEELGLADPRLAPADEIDVDVRLESLSDGVVVTGSVSAPWHDECRRCLGPIDDRLVVAVEELYKPHPDDQSFAIEGGQLDLGPMTKELVLLGLPMAPLCRDDCAGFCPTCGANRNEAPCDCAPVAADHRWSALDALRDGLE